MISYWAGIIAGSPNGQPWGCFSQFLGPSWLPDSVLGRPKAHWANSIPLWSTMHSPNSSPHHGVLKQKLILWSSIQMFYFHTAKTALYWPWMVFFDMLARCCCLNSLTMSDVPLPGAQSSITPGSLSRRRSEHLINPFIKCFGWRSTSLQKMSPKSGKPVKVAWWSLAVPWAELPCSFVRSTALEWMPFSKNRTVGGVATPADSLAGSFATGQLIKLSPPRAPDDSQLFSRPKSPGDAGP